MAPARKGRKVPFGVRPLNTSPILQGVPVALLSLLIFLPRHPGTLGEQLLRVYKHFAAYSAQSSLLSGQVKGGSYAWGN